MKYLIIAAVLCIFVGVSDALWCYKCSGSGCETPDTTVEGVYITECDDYTSLCFKQTITHYGESMYARGCTSRKSDCQPGCQGEPDNQLCESCCFSNLCNRSATVHVNLVLLVTTFLIGALLLRC
eukprot:XP_001178022.1 PREDICTED: uncharacterized protein LOC754064 [Strongylocentrotus purpuratus]